MFLPPLEGGNFHKQVLILSWNDMRDKFILAIAMLVLLVFLAYLHFQPGNGGSGESITAEDLSYGTGHAAPDFVLNDLYNRPVALNRYKGKVVLLGFWTTD